MRRQTSMTDVFADTMGDLGTLLRAALPFLPWAIVPTVVLWLAWGMLR